MTIISRLVLFTTLCGLLGACERADRQYDYSIFAFGTLIDITLYDVDAALAESAFEQLQKDFDSYHQQWSPWTDGKLAQLNIKLSQPENKNKPLTVSDSLLSLIETSKKLSRQSNNYYNPAIGRLINLWQFHRFQDDDIKPPPQKMIQSLLADDPKMSDITIDENKRISNANPAVSLNFGAFAKGYAIELEIKKLQDMGISNAVINAGGDLSVIGKHGDRLWNIGIRHPREDGLLASIEIQPGESVFTSGDYERVYYYQGKRYHHIINPATGYPTQDAQSVTVLHDDAGLADAAATALFVAGRKDWLQTATNMGIKYAMLVDANGNIRLTEAMEKRIKFLNKSSTSHIFVSKEL